MPIIRCSVVQDCSSSVDGVISLEATLIKLENYVITAAEDKVQMIVFPEAFIGGYLAEKFPTTLGESTQEPSIAREHYLAYHKAAIEISVDSATILRISEISRLNKITIAVGIIEKEGGTLYCTICFFDPEDGLVLKRRKLIPLSGEKLVWGFGDSSDIGKLVNLKLPATNSTNSTIQVDQSIVKVAGVICCENYIPLLRTHFYKLGAQIWAAPTVNGSTSYGNTMKHIAVEGRVFVLSASQLSLEKDLSNSDSEREIITGGSMIIDPFGNILAGPLRNKTGVLTADLDLDDIVRGKFDLDTVGHYARDDLFQLVVKQ